MIISSAESQLLKSDDDKCLSNKVENYVLEVKELIKNKDDADFVFGDSALFNARTEEVCEGEKFF